MLDVFPTLCKFAGIEVPANLDGIDISTLLTKRDPLPDRALFWRAPGGAAIRCGSFKYMRERWNGKEYLFNLDDDSGEENNLSQSLPEKFQNLKQMLTVWERAVDADNAKYRQ